MNKYFIYLTLPFISPLIVIMALMDMPHKKQTFKVCFLELIKFWLIITLSPLFFLNIPYLNLDILSRIENLNHIRKYSYEVNL